MRQRLRQHRALARRVVNAIMEPAWRNDLARYRRMSLSDLQRDYLFLQRACFGRNIFVNNAKVARAFVAFVLLVERDAPTIPNFPFQATQVSA